ncbi:MAG TPA: DUF1697 domain-containing protein [Marmoricola sp.]|nr:DUF1697 domain-containing protein [Marmoricola sp.]
MSSVWIAFQRAVNVGGRKYPMAELRQALTDAGYEGVETHIQTGNIRLEAGSDAAALEADLEAVFLADRGFEVETIVMSPEELAEIAVEADRVIAEFGEPAHGHYVDIMRSEPTAENRAIIEGRTSDTQRFVVRGRTVHYLSDISMADVKAPPAAVRRAYGVTTNRNAKVIRVLAAKWGTSD